MFELPRGCLLSSIDCLPEHAGPVSTGYGFQTRVFEWVFLWGLLMECFNVFLILTIKYPFILHLKKGSQFLQQSIMLAKNSQVKN